MLELLKAVALAITAAPSLIGDLVAAIRYYASYKEKTALISLAADSRKTQLALLNEIQKLRKSPSSDDHVHADQLLEIYTDERTAYNQYLSAADSGSKKGNASSDS